MSQRELQPSRYAMCDLPHAGFYECQKSRSRGRRFCADLRNVSHHQSRLVARDLRPLSDNSAAFRLLGICPYKYRPMIPLTETANMIQNAMPAKPRNLKAACRAITKGAAIPSST